MSALAAKDWADARLALVFGAAFVAAPLLASLARRIGFGDAPTQARKLQREAVPTVGGLALLGALALGPAEPWPAIGGFDPARAPWAIGLALALLYVAGALDDRFAFRATTKVALQILALLPLVAARPSVIGTGASGMPALVESACVLLAGLVALNLLNTFDNADGAVLGVSFVGALFAWPALAAACAGVLPWNLDAGRAARRAARAPTLYLGDAGVNVLALLILARPIAWPVLWIPALDLARLSVERWRAGSRPWIGDRRHLAHRWLAAGRSPPVVALVLAALTLPGTLGAALASRWPVALPAGLLAGALGFALALRLAPVDSR